MEVKSDIRTEIEKRAPWFHNIHLPTGEQTAPHHFLGDFPGFKWEKIGKVIPENLEGWKVLDVGCNAGFYSVELAKRGAEVTAIDLDAHYLRQARWVTQQFGLEDAVDFRQIQVYDLARTKETYDLVWFMGVFYHLRYPVLALDILSEKTKNMMVFQTLSSPGEEEMLVPQDVEFHKRDILHDRAWPKMAFIPDRLAGDPTNWWIPNHQGILSLLESCGINVTARPDTDTYIAKRNRDKPTIRESWNASEYLAATGRDWKKSVLQKTNK